MLIIYFVQRKIKLLTWLIIVQLASVSQINQAVNSQPADAGAKQIFNLDTTMELVTRGWCTAKDR